MLDDVQAQQEYDEFFEEIFVELEDKYGEIEEMNVCDNLGDHLVGNVYVRFHKEEDAEKAVAELNNRWFNQRPIHCELSPVTDFREACCRQYEMGPFTVNFHLSLTLGKLVVDSRRTDEPLWKREVLSNQIS
jgi:splicing factor U2AF subunit